MKEFEQDTELVAKVNGEGISKAQFETYKAGLALTSSEYTDEEILQKLIRQRVLRQECERLNLSVTDEAVDAFTEQQFAAMDDPMAYQIMQDFVDGLGITMEEYKERCKENYRFALLGDQYRAVLQQEYDGMDAAKPTFEQYYQQKLDDLTAAAEVELLI